MKALGDTKEMKHPELLRSWRWAPLLLPPSSALLPWDEQGRVSRYPRCPTRTVLHGEASDIIQHPQQKPEPPQVPAEPCGVGQTPQSGNQSTEPWCLLQTLAHYSGSWCNRQATSDLPVVLNLNIWCWKSSDIKALRFENNSSYDFSTFLMKPCQVPG